ncbi:class I SAM-dependent DNA methyltransferase [Streptomyces sp. JJ36]|uniref:type I restriction-modification system subunit M n=1 Tax=Streptomyces sp. JJ36 TaxID=2736645 RepID=UPI001F3FA395|nr:class I SAM-dependent DNA methyltransferase [Streptomyces sp. JJ36]
MPVQKVGATGQAEIHDALWRATEKLRGSVDVAAYKEFVLGLLFVRYLSEAFDQRRAELAEELAADGVPEEEGDARLESRDEYTGHGVFWIPREARWSTIRANVSSRNAGDVLDDAMKTITWENPRLAGALPVVFSRDQVDHGRLVELIQFMSDRRFTSTEGRPAPEVWSERFEHFLEYFARAEGKRGGEFHTPHSLAQLIVETLEPYEGRLYDSACGSGSLLVAATRFVERNLGRDHAADLLVHGQDVNERTLRLARMNLAIHGIDGNLGDHPADVFSNDQHPGLAADFVMTHPPFNMSAWPRDENDDRWRHGVPPAANANYAWLQHALWKLAPRGTAGVVLANGSMSSRARPDGEIRRALVEADQLACMVALPSQLFRTTSIPACLWLLAKDKSGQGSKHLADRRGQILFVDARDAGRLVDRTERVLTGDDISKIAGTYHAWRGTASARGAQLTYEDEPGFCFSADSATVREQDYLLTPGRYVGSLPQVPQEPPVSLRPASLMKDLYAIFD